MKTIYARNVNDAVRELLLLARDTSKWRYISPRGLETIEFLEPVATVYRRPHERVLFNSVRDANPFFHLMESIWIMAGREDVAFLTKYNAKMADFSDDGKKFHAPYGARLRRWPTAYLDYHDNQHLLPIDQVKECIRILKADRDSRQAVMSIWSPGLDLGAKTKDVPCNDLIMLKVRDGALNMTVCCRSNDAVWGAYGANAVQFSTLLEFMARAIGVSIGTYTQVSDSFHVYTDNEAWKRMTASPPPRHDAYLTCLATPYPLMSIDHEVWLHQAELFCDDNLAIAEGIDPFFVNVACPMQKAWDIYKSAGYDQKNNAITLACQYLFDHCHASDWTTAAIEWLRRRQHV